MTSDLKIDGSEIIYVNHYALVQIELAMNRYGARQAKFKYEFDDAVISWGTALDEIFMRETY